MCCPDAFDTPQFPTFATPTVKPGYTLPTLDENCGLNNGSFAKRVVGGVPAALG